MLKKGILSLVVLLVLGVGAVYFMFGSSKGSPEKSLEKFDIKGEALLRGEMKEVIEGYRDEHKDLDEWDIASLLAEEYGSPNDVMYLNGVLIEEEMSQEEMDSIVMRLPNDVIFPLSMPRRIITNPIDETQEIKPEDHSLRFLKDDEFMEEDFEALESGPRFYLDTEGFENISGLNIGYPMIYYSPDDEHMVSVRIHVAIEKDIEAKAFIEKLDKIDVNNQNVGEIYNSLRESDKMAVENSVVMLSLSIPFEDVFSDVSLDHQMDQTDFWKNYADYDRPVIKINDVKMELDPVTIDVLREGVYLPET